MSGETHHPVRVTLTRNRPPGAVGVAPNFSLNAEGEMGMAIVIQGDPGADSVEELLSSEVAVVADYEFPSMAGAVLTLASIIAMARAVAAGTLSSEDGDRAVVDMIDEAWGFSTLILERQKLTGHPQAGGEDYDPELDWEVL